MRTKYRDKMQRRRILKRGIGAVGGISMATTVVSADESIDTDFDPDSDAEIKEFARQFRQLSQRRRQEVYASLNKERKAAAKKAFAPAYAVSSTTSLGGVTQTGNTNKQATLSGYSALGFHCGTGTTRSTGITTGAVFPTSATLITLTSTTQRGAMTAQSLRT